MLGRRQEELTDPFGTAASQRNGVKAEHSQNLPRCEDRGIITRNSAESNYFTFLYNNLYFRLYKINNFLKKYSQNI